MCLLSTTVYILYMYFFCDTYFRHSLSDSAVDFLANEDYCINQKWQHCDQLYILLVRMIITHIVSIHHFYARQQELL